MTQVTLIHSQIKFVHKCDHQYNKLLFDKFLTDIFQMKALEDKFRQLKEQNEILKQKLKDANLAREKVRQLF